MKKKFTIKIEEKPPRMGHSPHRSGAGVHQDRRTKRARTRRDALKRALREHQ